ncbi:hypothetical protein CHGG_01238 [Chaetomium globosum CBS 148.51]|uniref:Chaetoglobosin A biosynthesis cluster protein C n=1 Tax=Chaetomium globosum (strain ATCC 6205 / CBS 148.51 / DSM 1962 / NBRC 6347 / NRRL 1970) TaxID=306901 RepID=CHEC_CHAGB|nr:uncharacterized protein CHGG_01238 [Chaetomium globosum CBS 148.51]Q2HEW6.1 RecName: Full=Chaetoglobosin A biosynthesis cluster protein C [Chaetomium globosum CBS 148.51]EAQ93003.1 hypothetical protein CHGG_01238 [Chaetomium globosum CBS 148.51]
MRSPPREARLRMAVEAIGKNKNLSIRAAARQYNVPEATIRHRCTGRSARRDLPANSRKLTDLEERTIVQYILELDARAFPPRLRGVEDMANHLLRERDAPPVGKLWAHNFVKRQPQLRTRRTRRYDYQRAKCEDPKVIGEWFTLVQDAKAKYGIVDDDVYNFDETGLMMGIIFAGQAYGRLIDELMRAHINHITKLEFLCAFREAFFASMTEKNIQGGFSGAGIVPFDPERVLSKLDVKLHTPTHPDSRPGTAQPWASKTPYNAQETRSQSDFIKTRISSYQNSSPASVLVAVDQLTKGATAVMHQVALLQSEVSSLRKANEPLSKRRKAKRTRIQLGGPLTVQDAQDPLDQRDVGKGALQETQPDSSGAGGARAKVRRCNSCCKVGESASLAYMRRSLIIYVRSYNDF